MKPASEILDCGIAGITTMRLEYLKSASKIGGSKIPSLWSSNRCYEELVNEGLVVEGPETKPGWQRHWLITDAGRAVLARS